MFWKKKEKEKIRRPGLTGTGEFIHNIDWWLWDDLESPGLISIDKFSELRERALSADQHRRLVMILTADSIVDARGRRQTSRSDGDFARETLKQVSDYLTQIRQHNFESLGDWLSSNFFMSADSWVQDQHGDRVNRDILRVLKAYINCLELWGFGYRWEEIRDVRGTPALLVSKHDGQRLSISAWEIQYINGKPYRFEVKTRLATWSFDSGHGSFTIFARSGEDLKGLSDYSF